MGTVVTRGRIRVFSRQKSRGISLMEILVTITIITALSAVLASAIFDRYKDARKATTKLEVDKIKEAAWLYRQDNQDEPCPSVEQLITERKLSESQNRQDPWGQPFSIVCDGDNILVASSGPDKKTGTEDDISTAFRGNAKKTKH